MNKKQIARAKMMNKKKQFKNKQILRTEEQLKEFKEKGLTFPSYNPLPQRSTEMTKGLKKINRKLKKLEKKRNETKTSSFVGWEYKDRFSYRKN